MFTNAAFLFFLLCVAIQLIFVLYFFIRIFTPPAKKYNYAQGEPVSVIICAKNEAENLRANLPAILAQRYTNDAGNTHFEVVVADDASTDDTKKVLNEMQKMYGNLVVVTIQADEERKLPGKKHAQARAVAAAKNDIFLMTDADCQPAGPLWLSLMVQPFKEGKEAVAGYGQYKTEPTLLNTFTRWETVHTFLQYSTYAKAGIPYMAVGRNLACTRAAYNKAIASRRWAKLPSGDDDLLIGAAGSKDNVAVVFHPSAFTTTSARPTWSSWARQKRRHLSTGKYYKFTVKTLLAKYGLSHAFVWLSFIVLLFTPLWGEALAIMMMRNVIYWLVWQRAACVLNEKKLIRFFPLFDFGWLMYNFAFLPYIIWKNKQQWT
ncbi:MAG: glycosyltransferase [Chitinophagaceae bacterium]|nr:glycosyltransferase [Chitinophagaceae bacterium]MCB9046692.1 glycosyltransferase [Chitinophagales bacterium]